jgi:hypothetical protein
MEVLFEALLGIFGAVLEGILDAVGEVVVELFAGVLAKCYHHLSAWITAFFN